MKIDRFLQIFVPKEKKFYPLYIEHATETRKSTNILMQIIDETDNHKKELLYKKVKAYEKKGDKIAETIYTELNKSFITPFDREDIHSLTAHLDTFLDYIHDAAKRLVIYNPRKIDKKLKNIIRFIIQDSVLLQEIMDNLKDIQKKPELINEKCSEIKSIEEEVDELYESFVNDLFSEEKDAIELIKQKDIVQLLEDATDRAKDVADVIRGIIIKFA